MGNNFTKLLWESISKILHNKRKKGKSCLSHKNIGIPHLVKIGKWKTLYDWEKEYFLKGVEDGKWDKKGNHLKDNNPYKNWNLKKGVSNKKVKKLFEN